MIPTKIELINFGPYKHLELDLTQWDNVLWLFGDNQDEQGCESNKVGKSKFIGGFRWGMFGTRFFPDLKDDIIKYGEKSCSVKISFGDDYIIRKMSASGAQTFDYVRSNQTQDKNVDAQELFLEDIGLGVESKSLAAIIDNAIFLNNRSDSLIFSTPSKRLEILTKWFDLEKFDKVIKVYRDKQKELSNELFILSSKEIKEIIDYDIKLTNVISDLNKKKEKLIVLEKEQEKFNNIRVYENELNILNTHIKNIENQNLKIITAKKSLADVDFNKLKTCLQTDNNKHKILVEEKESLQIKINEISTKISGLKMQLVNPKQCPNCKVDLYISSTELVKFDKEKVSSDLIDTTEEKKQLDIRMSGIKAKIEASEKTINESTSHINKLIILEEESKKEIVNLVKEDIRKKELGEILSTDIQDLSPTISHLKNDISFLDQEFGRYKSEKEKQISAISEWDKAKERTVVVKKELDEYKKWAGFDKAIGYFHEIKNLTFSEIISTLELFTNITLNELGIETKIQMIMKNNGIDIIKIPSHAIPNSLTGGEAVRMVIAMALALRRMYGIKLGLMALDELLSVVDSKGVEITIDLLKAVTGLKLMTSNYPIECENKIEFIKTDGETNVKS